MAKLKILKKFKKKEKKDKVKKKGRIRNGILMFIMTMGILVALLVLAFGLYIILTAPDFVTTKLYNKEATVLYDRDNNEIARVGAENRVLVTYNDLPQVLIDALVATEDSRFFQHNGFDAARFLSASIKQAMGKDAGGASTLTMQLAKNVYNGKDVSIVRKFKDIYMAVFKIEKSYTKEEIIEFYMNTQWLGYGSANYDGIYGIEQASQTYFGKHVSDLSLPEASMLVGMFNNPSYYHPIRNPKNCKSRQKAVLSLMARHGYITEEEAQEAGEIPIASLLKMKSNDVQTSDEGLQPFIEYVLDEVKTKTGSDPLTTPMAIYTTLDRNIQNVLTALENGELYKFVNDKVQNGMAVTSTQDGSILGLAPGRNYIKTGTNRALVRTRQIGSTAKPLFDYGPLIEYNNASTSQLFFDEPYTYSGGGTIRNYDGKHKGLITMREALIDSRNVPALQAFQQVDPAKISEFVHNLGIDYGNDLYESYSIGAFSALPTNPSVGGASPLDMSAAYATFGRGGYYIEPYSFTKIVYLENEEEVPYKYTKIQVMSKETAYMINNMLTEGGARNVGGNIRISNTDVAAKGGTTTIDEAQARANKIPTNATPDHWNIVYTTDYSIALWYGYDKHSDGYLTSTPGGQARRRIMEAVAKRILKPNARFEKPSGVVEVTVEWGTVPFELASSHTPEDLKLTSIYKAGTEPTTVSSRFDTLENPTNGNSLVNGSSIILTWNPIATPDAIDTEKLQTYFNENYKIKDTSFAEKYYNERIAYNNAHIGTLGYQVYLQNKDGSLISLGYTDKTTYTYVATEASEYTFVIKSAYSIFKANMSNGLTIKANLGTTSSITNDASLKSLTTNAGTLSPTFSKDVITYTLEVENTLNAVTFTGITMDPEATITSGLTCTLTGDMTSCKILVTAEDKKTTKTYTINVKRKTN